MIWEKLFIHFKLGNLKLQNSRKYSSPSLPMTSASIDSTNTDQILIYMEGRIYYIILCKGLAHSPDFGTLCGPGTNSLGIPKNSCHEKFNAVLWFTFTNASYRVTVLIYTLYTGDVWDLTSRLDYFYKIMHTTWSKHKYTRTLY